MLENIFMEPVAAEEATITFETAASVAADLPERQKKHPRKAAAAPSLLTDEKIQEHRRSDEEMGKTLAGFQSKVLAIGKRSTRQVFELGELFVEARKVLDGSFDAWVRNACGIEPRTTRYYRKVVEKLGDQRKFFEENSVSPTVLIRLAAKPDLIDVAIAKIRAGKRLAVKDLRELEYGMTRVGATARATPPSRAPGCVAAMVRQAERDARRVFDKPMKTRPTGSREAEITTLADRLDGLATFLGQGSDSERWSRLADSLRKAVQPDYPQSVDVACRTGSVLLERIARLSGQSVVEPQQLLPGADRKPLTHLRAFELCAGAGGMALGFQRAGFEHAGLAEWNPQACETLRANFPGVSVHEGDIGQLDFEKTGHIDVLYGGPPCPPFSIASVNRLGERDERNLFPVCLDLVQSTKPIAVVFENVGGAMDQRFAAFRAGVQSSLTKLGYHSDWKVLNAADFGVPQNRNRSFLIAFNNPDMLARFEWPTPHAGPHGHSRTIGDVILPLLRANGWVPSDEFVDGLQVKSRTIIGGSEKKQGIDLGQANTRSWWKERGIDPNKIASAAPQKGFTGLVPLTLEMVAAIQDFPEGWTFKGNRREKFRQIANAVPQTLAAFVAAAVRVAITGEQQAPERIVYHPFSLHRPLCPDDFFDDGPIPYLPVDFEYDESVESRQQYDDSLAAE